MKRWTTLGIIVLIVVLFGCTTEPAALPDATPTVEKGDSVTGATLNEQEAGERHPFTIPVEEANREIGLDIRGALTRGELRPQVVDAEGEIVWSERIAQPGPFGINTQVTLPEPGEYRVGVVWAADTQASYSIHWKPGAIEVPDVRPAVLVSGIGMIAVALGAVVYVSQRAPAWKYLGFGAAAWIVTVVLKFIWAGSFNGPLYQALGDALPETIGDLLFYLYVGLLTGIFEVGLTWLALRYTSIGRVRWGRALAFSVGFGAVEAFILGLASLGNALIALNSPNLLPLSALEGFAQASNLLYSLAPVSERFFTILIHVASNVLLFYGVQIADTERSGARYVWYAFAFKTGIDAVAAFAQFWGIDTLARLWTIEAIVILWGVAGYWITRRVHESYKQITND
jgi:uncharacterized membrane protein YhfC